MKPILPRLTYFLIAPLAFALMGGGLWLTIHAQKVSGNFGAGVEQILRGVAQARGMRILPGMDARLLASDLVMTLVQKKRGDVQIIQGLDPSRENNKALGNPWGGQTRFYVYPQAYSLRVEAEMDGVACRRYTSLLVQDAPGLGVQRIDTLLDHTTGVWRLIYEGGKTAADDPYLEPAIRAACGSGDGKTVSVTFSIK